MKRSIILLCLVIALLLPSVMALATMKAPLTITASNSAGKSASWTYNWSNGASYTLGSPYQLKATDGTVLGYINSLSCGMANDPFLNLNFAVTAVGTATFLFDTGEMTFASIGQPVAFATASATITADGTGGTFTGLFAGGKAYQATYNGGTVFADLDGTMTSAANSSNTENERNPPPPGSSAFTPIGTAVSSMRTQWNFTLTDGDQASGTSRFEIQPVPDAGTLALAFSGAPLLAGFAIRRRRRV